MSTGSNVRLFALADVRLDQPWPMLGVAQGAARRQQSLEGLLEAIGHARTLEAGVLVIGGGLFDRRTVSSTTLATVGQAFEAFGGSVVLRPGGLDCFTTDSPHATTKWPDNVHLLGHEGVDHVEVAEEVTVWGRAASGSRDWAQDDIRGPRSPREGVHISIIPPPVAATDDQYSQPGLPPSIDQLDAVGVDHVLIAGSFDGELHHRVSITGSLMDLRGGRGRAVALDVHPDRRSVHATVQPLSVALGGVIQRSIDDVASTADLHELLDGVPESSRVNVTGTLAEGVVLPSDVAPISRLDLSNLTYALASPDPADRTATGEFIRWVLDQPIPDRDRHQAIAIGLDALDRARRSGAPAEVVA